MKIDFIIVGSGLGDSLICPHQIKGVLCFDNVKFKKVPGKAGAKISNCKKCGKSVLFIHKDSDKINLSDVLM